MNLLRIRCNHHDGSAELAAQEAQRILSPPGIDTVALLRHFSFGLLVVLALAGCDTAVTKGDGSHRAPIAPVPAFPGAEGWGATALNACRSLPLRIHHVTHTGDSGPGSLRNVLENQTDSRHYDVVIFRTGGTIALEARQIRLEEGCVYVAGQTAPGGGIMIRSHPTLGLNGHLIRITQRADIVFRFLRLRHGHEGGKVGGGLILTGSGNGRDIMYDHLSASWGGGNSMLQIATSDQSNPDHTLRGSIQNSIMAEGFENRGASFRATGGGGDSHRGLRQMSFHRNLMALNGQRNPAVRAGDARMSHSEGVEVVNNVMYGATNRFTEGNDNSVLDHVGNFQDSGPHHSYPFNRWSGPNTGAGGNPLDPNDPGSLFVEGNIALGPDGVPLEMSQWELWRDHADGVSLLPDSYRRDVRMAAPRYPISEVSSLEAQEWVLGHAGASLRLNCLGGWVSNRDAVDRRIVTYVETRSPSLTPAATFAMTADGVHGGWPDMDPGTACRDSDGDGIPDQWEALYFGCITCAVAKDMTPSGYLVVEHYLNGSSPW